MLQFKVISSPSSAHSVSSHFRASTAMGCHGEAAQVVLRVSDFGQLPVWHCSQPPTGNTQRVETEAVKLEAR